MKTEKEIIADKDLVFTEMQKIKNGRQHKKNGSIEVCT